MVRDLEQMYESGRRQGVRTVCCYLLNEFYNKDNIKFEDIKDFIDKIKKLNEIEVM